MYQHDSLIIEIQKRPFLRPLIFWIAGILLQVCFPLQQISFILLFVALSILFFSFFVSGRPHASFLYSNRWVWGLVFSCLVVFLAIQTTALAEKRFSRPQETGLLLSKAQEVRSRMVAKLDNLQLPDEDKSVLATLTVNYRKAMSRDLRNRFSVTGVAHLLSVSGFHVGIVCAFIRLLLSVFRRSGVVMRWVRYLVTLSCVWVFTFVSALDVAAVRAAVMLTIYITGGVLVRQSDRYNTLAGAAFCMLAYNPFYLFDIGFQLSYTAVFFLLYLQPRLSSLIEIRNPIIANPWNVLTVTIAAQIGTCFLCFYYFGQSSMVFLFTNLSLSLLSTLLIPAALIWMIVPATMPGIDILRWAIEAMTRCLMWVVDHYAAIPGATLSLRFDFPTLILSYLCMAFFFMYFHSRRYWILIASLATLLVIICWQMISIPTFRPIY